VLQIIGQHVIDPFYYSRSESRISPRIEHPANFDSRVIQIERNANDLSRFVYLNGN